MSKKELEDLLSKKPVKHKPMPIINIDEFANTPQDYKPKKIAGTFNDKYIECKSKGNERVSIEQYFKKIKTYLGNITGNIKASG